MSEQWEHDRDFVRAKFSDADAVMVSSVVRVRYQVFAAGHYWGRSQKYPERAWMDAANEIRANLRLMDKIGHRSPTNAQEQQKEQAE